ncbi:type ISP restriction/modification enzyme [Phormidesmis sp. 146-35]
MSKLLVSQYHAELDRIIQYGGSKNETSIRNAFERLLNEYCKPRDFLLIPELEYKTRQGKVVYPDGTVKDALRLDWGYWESKDQDDCLDREIEKKFEKGYPNDNILFEDSQTAILIQSGHEVARISMRDTVELDAVLGSFTNYVRPEVKDFREAVRTFKQDLPTMLETLRSMLQMQEQTNVAFCQRRNRFWEVCKESINPEVTLFDVQEMLIQHILTEDIFLNIFNESQFHRENNIARELHEIVQTFFTGATRRNTLSTIERYYAVIRRTAANIYNHHEKQKFLKAIYENFYKAYNPKAADRLGIVYTPNEIVRFMIESADYLVHKHFGKLLADPGVEILDPATGTGTFVTELIEYLPKDKLEHKYKHEIHCNDVGILPYYIANLNIEFTYQQKMGKYEEFSNICLVDTLDHTTFEGKQGNLLSMSVENTERIKRQNEKTISIVIGNPPYNANQTSENDNNKNREYLEIDKLIKATYIKESTAQKTKLYDMYSRFFRWATNRLNENGILAFITNSSFIYARTFDGFRKVVSDEFSAIYIIDLGGDVRKNPKLSGTTHNVFGIQTGVAISFMIKNVGKSSSPCQIFYARRPEFEMAEAKLKFLNEAKFLSISFEHLQPDENFDWINISASSDEFKRLLPVLSKETKLTKSVEQEKALFKLYTGCIKSNRDEWVYDLHQEKLLRKILHFVKVYNGDVENYQCSEQSQNVDNVVDYSIKWSRDLKKHLISAKKVVFRRDKVVQSIWRPFVKKYFYSEPLLSDILTSHHQEMHGEAFERENIIICISGTSFQKQFQTLAVKYSSNYDFLEKTQCIPLYRYDKTGNRIDNITDWGLQQFQQHYNDTAITKENIFHYTYAVLHNPAYRSKYELNLKREFPRLPYYPDFQQWVNWGKQLMDLHINYETVEPFGLKLVEIKTTKNNPKPKLKADQTTGIIYLDETTQLEGVPPIAFDYKLGNRSALEWILDQHKEKKPKDATIAAKFNTYRFADYKDHAIDLLQKVCTVSVETMKIIGQMGD